MRKLSAKLSLLVFAATMTGAVYAQDGEQVDYVKAPSKNAKRLSVALGVGVRPDMAQLGATITKDGTLDTPTGAGNLAKDVYSTGQVFMSDRHNMLLKHNSDNTGSSVKVLDSFQEGGAMLGMEIGGNVQYDLDSVLNLPLFVRAGFNYTFKISGGEQSRTLGSAAVDNASVKGLMALNGLDANDFVGGKMSTTWDASWIEVPIMFGFRLPITARTSAYAGLGISFFQGGFSLDVNADEKYANVLSTYIDADKRTAKNYHSGGAVKELIEFNIGAIGINYLIGLQTGVGNNVVVFMELNGSGASKTVFNSKLGEKTQKLLTATQSETLASGTDDTWFKRLAFPVVLSGATARIGARYYIN